MCAFRVLSNKNGRNGMTLFQQKCVSLLTLLFFKKTNFLSLLLFRGESVCEDKFYGTLSIPPFQIAPFRIEKV